MPAFQSDAEGRIHELERSAKQLQIKRGTGLQPGIVQKSRRKLIVMRWDSDHFSVFPVQLGHPASGGIAMHAFRIVEKQENLALLKRKRLSVDGDGFGRLQ